MEFTLHPWQLNFLILAGWVNRQQQTVIDYLRTENQVLREKPRSQTLESAEIRHGIVIQRAMLAAFEGRSNYFTLRDLCFNVLQ